MKPKEPELIVMLTHHDFTVSNAAKIFEQCRESKARCWGMKEHRLPPEEMRSLFTRMKACGKMTFLEVVGYTEEEGLAGAELAFGCGCDVMMGTKYFDSINDFCKSHNLKYMPFVGKVTGRPSVLDGTMEEIIDEAHGYIGKGVFGIDLLGYRYEGDARKLISRFIKEVEAPVCLAGSIDGFERLDEVREVNPWAYTIGSAFFEGKFLRETVEKTTPSVAMDAVGENNFEKFCEQINTVCEYMGLDK